MLGKCDLKEGCWGFCSVVLFDLEEILRAQIAGLLMSLLSHLTKAF